MAYFAVIYDYSAPEAELAKVRADHRAYLASLEELQLSGPFTDDDAGALLIFAGATEADILKLLDEDPFWVAGFIGDRRIRSWNPVLGQRINIF